MTSVFIFMVLSFIVLGVVSAIVGKSKGGIGHLRFRRKKLLSSPEQVLYHRLVRALPELHVFAQVAMAEVVSCSSPAGRNKFMQKRLDFLLCRPDMSVLAAIELDDSTHLRPARVKADADKDLILQKAGIPIVRWHVKSIPSEEAIRQAFGPSQSTATLQSQVFA